MFRRLYWVTEFVLADGSSQVAGVYTSVPDLIRRGLSQSHEGMLRLTLAQLDSNKAPLGSWTGPDFAGFEEGIQPYVRTDEFSVDEVKSLVRALEVKLRVAA